MTRRVVQVAALMSAVALFAAGQARAQPEGTPCDPEPTDQLMRFGDHVVGCEIGIVGDSDLFRFYGVAGEAVAVRATDVDVASAPVIELIRPNGTVLASAFAGGTVGLDRILDQTGTFTIRVTEWQNDGLMTYAVQLDRLAPPSPTATSINPGETLLGHVIAPVGDADLFVFNGVSGDVVSIRVTDPSLTRAPVIELFRPNGTILASAFAGGTVGLDRTLDQTGSYTIRITEWQNDQDMTFNVEFNCIVGSCPTFHTLQLTRSGGGLVTSTPVGIECGTDCLERYFDGTVVSLAATADPGWTFAGWTGDSDCTDGAVTMNGDRRCIATFTSGGAVPTTLADAYGTSLNTPLTVPAPGVLANDNSNGGGPMTAVLVTSVSQGFLALNTNGGFTYTPNTGFTGTDSFSYRASNANGVGNIATVTVAVTSAPPPTAADDTYTVTANATLNVSAPGVLGNDASNGSGPLSAALVSTTSRGSLAFSVTGAFTYVPGADFVGTDTFSYRATNGGGASNTATVTITVAQPTTPQSPRDLVVDSVAGQQVTVRFTAPPLGPAPTGYILKGGVLPGQVLAAIPTGSDAPIFTFVAPSGSFYIRMHTLTGVDESDPSNEVPLHVNVPVPPSAPARLIRTVSGSSLALAWKNTYQGGAPSDLVLDVSGSFNGSFSLGVTDRFDFPAVPSGSYTLSVRAVNPGGSSPSSNAVTLAFPGACSGAPLMPSNFLAYKTGSTIIVLWDPPESGPAPTSYVLNVTGAYVGTVPTTARMLSGTVGPGAYALSVRAVSPCGSSAFTPAQVVSIP